MYITGIRIRTLGELRERHIDFVNLCLNLDGSMMKNHKFLKLPIDPKLVCSCGEKMTVFEEFIYLQTKKRYSEYAACEGAFDEEYEDMVLSILDHFSNRGLLYYGCNNDSCSDNTGIGVYICQRDEVDDLVWEHGVHED